ncbi:MAG: biopolymer transporter ExbD [Planctomycetia bacterium]|nr:biopolymer transporter ExbD [Planctomycetia bacterium]
MAVKINKGETLSGLSITPLVDVVFLLLIFFLVATRFVEDERALDIQLPTASEAVPLLAEPKELVINIDASGKYFMAGKPYALPQVESVLKATWDGNPTGASVIIRGDRRSPFGAVVNVANICRSLDLKYSTVTKETEESHE